VAFRRLGQVVGAFERVESERVGATVFRRRGKGWTTIELTGGDARLRLTTIGLDIELAALYRGVPGLAAG